VDLTELERLLAEAKAEGPLWRGTTQGAALLKDADRWLEWALRFIRALQQENQEFAARLPRATARKIRKPLGWGR
jgi:hypothetical protein